MGDEFEEFVRATEPRLRRALAGHLPTDRVHDGLSEAFAHAWSNWDRVRTMENPAGYLFRVAQSKSRTRLEGALPETPRSHPPHVEPGLIDAMRGLPRQQRSVVWLVHACDWTYAEVAEALGISASAVGTHLTRGISTLRARLGVNAHD
jgi:DNA-directed RNA polymerase specialized sigma24 family protein